MTRSDEIRGGSVKDGPGVGDREGQIQVQINGESRWVGGGRNLTELLTDLGLHPQLIVVEHNREIIDRDEYPRTEVREGDTLELVHFVGGG